MKKIVKGMAGIAIAVSVILGSVFSPTTAEAKGTAFINKKVTSVTPTVKAKRSNGAIRLTITVPLSKVKKLRKSKNGLYKITIAYGTTKNSKKFEAKKCKAEVMLSQGNQFKVSIFCKNEMVTSKNAYVTVKFDNKSNWSKLVKVSGKAIKVRTTYWLRCNECGKEWTSHKSMEELEKKFNKHCEDSAKAFWAKWAGASMEDILASGETFCGSYTNGMY